MEDQNILEMPRDLFTIIESPRETFDEFQHEGQNCPNAPRKRRKRIEYDLETVRKRLFKMERECDAQSASLFLDEDFNSCCNI